MLSVISLIQHSFDVGLAEIFYDLIEYYRKATYLCFNFIGGLISIKMPPVLMDLWAISFIGAGAYVKTPKIEQNRLLRNRDVKKSPKYWKAILFLFMGVTFIGLAIILSAFRPQTYIDDMSDEPMDLLRGTLKNVFIVLAGALVFFAINAYAPSL
ncbi:hypothetical protein EGX57_18110 [Vibrio cholerae]|nr:hypothetical protein [Vibrio cholerae]